MIVNIFKWFFGALGDDIKKTMSLSRITYLLAFIIAGYSWYNSKEIMPYHFYFLLINLLYLLFRYKALDLIEKIVALLISSKNVIVNTVVNSVEKEIKNDG